MQISPRLVLLAALTGSTSIGAQPKALKMVWEHPTPGHFPQALACDALARPYLYAALKNGGLAVLDISKPRAAPKQIATLGIEHFDKLEVMHFTQHRHRLYVALGNFFDASGSRAGLAVVSVKNPQAPEVVSLWKSRDTMRGSAFVLVQGNLAYLGAMERGVMIFDTSDPSKLTHLATIQPDVHFPRKNPGKVQHPNARGLALRDHLLYVAYDAGGLRVIDVADPRKPREIGRYINATMLKKQQAYNNLVLDGTTACIAVDYAGLEIVDIGDPRNMKQIGWWNPWEAHTLKNLWFNSPGHTNQIEYDGKRRLVYLSAGDSDLQVVDVSDKTRPMLHAFFGGPKDKLGVWGLTMSADRVYLAYIPAFIPFHGAWAGIKAIER